jgi:uncharacterized membrane protein YhaH (DUF805 family)
MEQPSSPGAPSPRDPRLTQEQLTALALGADPERVSLTQLYLSVKGRIPRRTFWLHGVLSLLALAFVINCLMEIARIGDNIAVWTVILGFAWPFIAVTTKRLHDFNLSAWWLPLGVAGIGLLLMLVFSFSAWWLLGNFVGISFLGMIVAGLVPGTRGPNRFGIDPREALVRARINSGH